MTAQNSAYEQVMRLLPSLSPADRLLLLETLRRQVESANVREPLEEFQQRIDVGFGIWADRTDLPEDSSEYVRQLRNGWDERLERIQGEVVDKNGSS